MVAIVKTTSCFE